MTSHDSESAQNTCSTPSSSPDSFGPRPTPKRTYVVTPAVVTPTKSYAQVATLVTPRGVTPKSGGLKPGARRQKRRNPLTVRMSEPELDIVRAKAKAAGCTLNGYVRASVLGSHYKPPLDPGLRRALLKVNLELTRQGRNLNQIAHAANVGTDICATEAALCGLRTSLASAHTALRDTLASYSNHREKERP